MKDTNVKDWVGPIKRVTIRRPSDWAVVFRGWSLELFGRSIGVHVFHNADDPGCFHTHPATAFRLVLWGGYVEENVLQKGPWWTTYTQSWLPGQWGIVRPEFEHRIDGLLNGRSSVSLWMRGKLTDPIHTRGC